MMGTVDTMNLDMDDFFESNDPLDDEDQTRAMPPPGDDEDGAGNPFVEGEAGADGDGEDDDGEVNSQALARLKDLSKGAGKKVVKRPQPKLDPSRLTGERGIPILPDLFKNVKFKGAGHEATDLQRLMRTMEHWGHRLFPKMTFDEVIERAERLGAKRETQTCVKKIRMGMSMTDDDFVSQQDSDGANSDNNDAADIDKNPEDGVNYLDEDDLDAEEAFEEMMRQERANTQQNAQSQNNQTQSQNNPTQLQNNQPPMTPSSAPAPKPSGNSTMTEEQRARMEANKRKAMEKRLAKQNPGWTPNKSQPTSTPPTSTQPSASQPTPSDGSLTTSQNEDETVAMEVDQATEDELLAALDDDFETKEPSAPKDPLMKENNSLDTPETNVSTNQNESVRKSCDSDSQNPNTETLDLHLTETMVEEHSQNVLSENVDKNIQNATQNESEDFHLKLSDTMGTADTLDIKSSALTKDFSDLSQHASEVTDSTADTLNLHLSETIDDNSEKESNETLNLNLSESESQDSSS
ncbi:unnamed protein product [Owenia fusiformis]|uniref:TIMELESS-interacting protein n=1 Tax=Owenia fusiformis TaxID=6347 RepID=A0A8J1TX06_OWEFU|nr:unnamed protein product [Owenia fusiformis]